MNTHGLKLKDPPELGWSLPRCDADRLPVAQSSPRARVQRIETTDQLIQAQVLASVSRKS